MRGVIEVSMSTMVTRTGRQRKPEDAGALTAARAGAHTPAREVGRRRSAVGEGAC